MERVMTTIHLSDQQITRLRKRVLELKATVPNLTNSTVIRYSLDYILSNWELHSEAVARAGKQDTRRKYQKAT